MMNYLLGCIFILGITEATYDCATVVNAECQYTLTADDRCVIRCCDGQGNVVSDTDPTDPALIDEAAVAACPEIANHGCTSENWFTSGECECPTCTDPCACDANSLHVCCGNADGSEYWWECDNVAACNPDCVIGSDTSLCPVVCTVDALCDPDVDSQVCCSHVETDPDTGDVTTTYGMKACGAYAECSGYCDAFTEDLTNCIDPCDNPTCNSPAVPVCCEHVETDADTGEVSTTYMEKACAAIADCSAYCDSYTDDLSVNCATDPCDGVACATGAEPVCCGKPSGNMFWWEDCEELASCNEYCVIQSDPSVCVDCTVDALCDPDVDNPVCCIHAVTDPDTGEVISTSYFEKACGAYADCHCTEWTDDLSLCFDPCDPLPECVDGDEEVCCKHEETNSDGEIVQTIFYSQCVDRAECDIYCDAVDSAYCDDCSSVNVCDTTTDDPVCCTHTETDDVTGDVTTTYYEKPCAAYADCSDFCSAWTVDLTNCIDPCDPTPTCADDDAKVCCQYDDKNADGEAITVYESVCEAIAGCDEYCTIVDGSHCEDTGCICTEEWDPVCCGDVTYSNQCFSDCDCEVDFSTSGACDPCEHNDCQDNQTCEVVTTTDDDGTVTTDYDCIDPDPTTTQFPDPDTTDTDITDTDTTDTKTVVNQGSNAIYFTITTSITFIFGLLFVM